MEYLPYILIHILGMVIYIFWFSIDKKTMKPNKEVLDRFSIYIVGFLFGIYLSPFLLLHLLYEYYQFKKRNA